MKGTEAIDAVRDQMAQAKDDYVATLGELMTEYLRLHPETELPEGSTLKGAFEHLKGMAKKKAKGGCYAMPPKEIFDGMMEYYGLKPEDGDAGRCFAAAIGQTAPDPVCAPEPVRAAAPARNDPFDLDSLLGGL